MSDFIDSYWSIFIAAITLIGIVWCVWLLGSQRKVTVEQNADGSVADTGHVWDGDLRELNNPLPRWWAWMFLLSCVFSLIYLVLYPGLGSYPGLLGYTSDTAYTTSVVKVNEELKPIYAKYMEIDVQQVAADPRAREMGQRLYLNYCAQCHGSDAGGSKGFPNLTDNDWLYGGSPEMIKTAILQGRSGVMPAFTHLSKADVTDLTSYVRSLSGLSVDPIKAERGSALFATNCVACHAVDGKGNTAIGAPNLTDKIWLYGSTDAAVTESIAKGRNGQMPAHDAILTPEKVQLISAYVWSLTNIRVDQAKKIVLEALPNPKVIPIQSVEESLYEVRRKIYPRSVSGIFARWRIVFVFLTQIVFYGLPWLSWNSRQAVLFDLVQRKFYIFGLVLWPQDVIYLTLLLILSALSLFLFTAVAGRLFCGYACPQTVYTELFMWIERKVEGDRFARIRLDGQEWPWKFAKWRIKITKHGLWLMVAFLTGFTFVGYFTPIHTLAGEVLTASLGPWQAFWLFFYSFATWGNAGFMREQVCKYMCPYARFQSVMVDKDTFVVTYDTLRGEPRGSRNKSENHAAQGLGDCVDCSICVQVCPTGIDIRDGLQYMCIGCGACIDACDQVMDKMHYPKGLIRYTTERAMLERAPTEKAIRQIFRPRIIFYTSVILVLATAFLISLATRNPLRADVMRDRGALAREVDGARIENVYRIQVMNASENTMRVNFKVTGLPDLQILTSQGKALTDVLVEPSSNQLIPIRVSSVLGEVAPGNYPIHFGVEGVEIHSGATTTVRVRDEKSTFIVPR